MAKKIRIFTSASQTLHAIWAACDWSHQQLHHMAGVRFLAIRLIHCYSRVVISPCKNILAVTWVWSFAHFQQQNTNCYSRNSSESFRRKWRQKKFSVPGSQFYWTAALSKITCFNTFSQSSGTLRNVSGSREVSNVKNIYLCLVMHCGDRSWYLIVAVARFWCWNKEQWIHNLYNRLEMGQNLYAYQAYQQCLACKCFTHSCVHNIQVKSIIYRGVDPV